MAEPARRRMRLALAQMCSGDTHADNIATLHDLVDGARAARADVLALPEVAGLMTRDAEAARASVTDAASDPFIAACRAAAAGAKLWIHTGSTPVLAPDGRFLNRSTVIDDTGALRATYDKIHLFDVALEGQPPIGESKRFAPGARAEMLTTPWGLWGLSICYDLRFPHLYRTYAQRGADVLFIPSAFTVPTGRDHWEVLLRARAIENGAFVVAAAQSGTHADGRQTYGHAMVVDPWGHVLTDMGIDAPAITLVELDLSAVAKARAQIPSVRADTPFAPPVL